MKRLEDMTFDELREVIPTIDDNEVREAAYDLICRAEQLQKEVADRVIKLIGSKYDPPESDA